MNVRAQIRMLPDGRRVHMQDGPVDLIVEACGPPEEVERASRAAATRFVTILDELCGELMLLRQPARKDGPHPDGGVARRMVNAAIPLAVRHFITPMAAVAGAVAEEILAAMTGAAQITRAYVNDGGDIALHLTPGERFVVGMIDDPERARWEHSNPTNQALAVFGTTTIDYECPIRGIATSGWRGRSFSLGIADAVTVLAETASMADAAATIIANGVDLPEHPAIGRVRACDLAPDSDLGERLVTQSVPALSRDEIERALESGVRQVETLRASGLIYAAALSLQGEVRTTDLSNATLLMPARANPVSSSRSLVHA